MAENDGNKEDNDEKIRRENLLSLAVVIVLIVIGICLVSWFTDRIWEKECRALEADRSKCALHDR